MNATVCFITPPFTQLNTPYPATAYLKGFLNTKGISSFQCDLGIETTLALFSEKGLTLLFAYINSLKLESLSDNSNLILQQHEDYLQTINDVISFLQGNNPSLAHRVAQRNFLPEAGRFKELANLQDSFGLMGIQDKAKYLATLYLEDLSDLIKESVDEHFGFSRYAERLGRCANSFDELYESLQQPISFIDKIYLEIFHELIVKQSPKLLAISIPFPGNLFAGLRCAQYIKKHFPQIKIAMGGGFANTELRSLSDSRLFEFIDFVCLDDGELPLENLIKYIEGEKEVRDLVRTFIFTNGNVVYVNNNTSKDYSFANSGTPDYADIKLKQYINALEIVNPMNSLWTDGKWLKLTLAHGCYWGKCTFCDTSLDYISRYEPLTAAEICDRMQAMIDKTECTGFHFVDEAAPPSLLKALAIELLNRKMVVSWWTNIRFEKSFTRDVCMLLKASGCIGVSGGLEVASDRLLALINKGVTVVQVAKVNRHFTDAGIMVHAYLMYGFPTQTAQETMDSLELVRQMFEAGILQSAFWHLFTMTAHSPVGLCPEKFKVKEATAATITFANNDVPHLDPIGADHETFSYGLKKSLHNYLHHQCLDKPLHTWFDFKTPKPSIANDYIKQCLEEEEMNSYKPTARVVFFGHQPISEPFIKSKKGAQWEMLSLKFVYKKEQGEIKLSAAEGNWLLELLKTLAERKEKITTMQHVKDSYEQAGFEDFELFWFNKPMNGLWRFGLWVV